MESNHLESPEENDTTSPSQQVSNDTATQNGKNVQNEMSVKNGSNEKDKNDLTEDVPNITFNHNSNVSFAALPSPPIMQPLQPILPMHPTIPIPGMMDPSFAAMPIHGGMPMGGMHIGGVPNLPQFAPIYPMNHQIPDINLNIGGGIPGMPPIPSMPFGLQPHPFQPTPFDANPVNPVNGKNNTNKGGDAVPTLNSISRQTQNQYFCRTRQQLEMLDTYKAGTPLTNNKENENKTTNNNNNSEQQLQEKIKQLQSLQQQHLQLTAGQPFPHPLSKIDENAIQKNVIPNGSLFPNLLTQSHLAQLQQKSNTNPNPNPNPNTNTKTNTNNNNDGEKNNNKNTNDDEKKKDDEKKENHIMNTKPNENAIMSIIGDRQVLIPSIQSLQFNNVSLFNGTPTNSLRGYSVGGFSLRNGGSQRSLRNSGLKRSRSTFEPRSSRKRSSNNNNNNNNNNVYYQNQNYNQNQNQNYQSQTYQQHRQNMNQHQRQNMNPQHRQNTNNQQIQATQQQFQQMNVAINNNYNAAQQQQQAQPIQQVQQQQQQVMDNNEVNGTNKRKRRGGRRRRNKGGNNNNMNNMNNNNNNNNNQNSAQQSHRGPRPGLAENDNRGWARGSKKQPDVQNFNET